MSEEALISICDAAACKEDPFFYEIFERHDRLAIIRAILKAVQNVEAAAPSPAQSNTEAG